MSGPRYRKGDHVEIVRWGVVVHVDPKDPHRFGIGQPGSRMVDAWFRADAAEVRHRLLTAAEWPPVPEDAWRDRDGKQWKAVEIDCPDCTADGRECEDGYVALKSEFGAWYPGSLQIAQAHRYYGPFTLEKPSPRRSQERPC
ncbi:hypothetical protein [Nonomuraea sp. NPDC049758]|uniref:hypothetical protein n=1 Tax=Nonomuraea sp. NPDC049758 TaxID=3154360 RepID=UPI003415129C